MNKQVQLRTVGNLRSLRSTLDDFSEKSPFNSVFLVSMDGFPVDLENARESELIIHEFQSYCRLKQASVFQISPFEYAFLTEVSEGDAEEKSAELKILILGIIQNLYPNQFPETDHTRVVRKLSFPERLENFKTYIHNRHAESVSSAGPRPVLHTLCEDDLTKLNTAFSKKSPEDIAKDFISKQAIYVAKKDEPLKPVADEYFVSIDAIKKTVLPNVDFRSNTALFNHMTLSLDKILLRSLYHVSDRNYPMSINLNVESVFSNDFKKFVGMLEEKDLQRIQIEFRQADILQHLSKYNLVGKILAKFQGSTVIDAVFPNTVGLLRIERLSPSFVKIFWHGDSDVNLTDKRDDIEQIKKAGIFPVLARVDDEEGYQTGLELGINLFQGFYFDGLVKND